MAERSIDLVYCAASFLRCDAATKSYMRRWSHHRTKEQRLRKLGQTIAALARHRRHWSTLLQSTAVMGRPAAKPTHLTELTGFGSNPGALRMFTYVPKKLAAAPALVVVLHGCTQSAASYDLGTGWSTLAERYGFVLLLPEQTAENNPKTCFNWFLPGDTVRDRGEVLSIRQMVEKTIG